MGGAPNEGRPGLVAEADDDGGGGEDIHRVLHRVFTEAPGVPAPHKPHCVNTAFSYNRVLHRGRAQAPRVPAPSTDAHKPQFLLATTTIQLNSTRASITTVFH